MPYYDIYSPESYNVKCSIPSNFRDINNNINNIDNCWCLNVVLSLSGVLWVTFK